MGARRTGHQHHLGEAVEAVGQTRAYLWLLWQQKETMQGDQVGRTLLVMVLVRGDDRVERAEEPSGRTWCPDERVDVMELIVVGAERLGLMET